MGTLLLLTALFIRDFTLDRLSRVLIPLLIIFALLVPVLFHSYADIVFILLCSGYVYARVFYTVAYVSIAQTKTIPVLPLVALAIAADSFGVIAGEVFCITALRGELSPQTMYIITSVVIGLIILTGSFFLREKNIVSLWGLRKLDYSDEIIEKKCLMIALDHNLTLRETQITVSLAKGLTAETIAQELGVSLATVRTHTRNIYSKMDIHSQPELIRMIVFTEPTSKLV
ncbi:MAG: helix-turn-helix transcriptional regulator [Actinobacteria bacterium]|nr:helix-turn-helix transcriptional regulator [Actinomycetota bacterium]